MANKAFLVPVVIDDTRDDDENVPDKFHDVSADNSRCIRSTNAAGVSPPGRRVHCTSLVTTIMTGPLLRVLLPRAGHEVPVGVEA